MVYKKISIIGLGLIGGSIAKALKERLNINIVALDTDENNINLALSEGYINEGHTSMCGALFDSDVIFICTPVKVALEYIMELCDKVSSHTILTDVGSTKGEIINYINSLENPPCFIGGHPMTGAEKTGFSAAFSHLFENVYYILSPTKSTTKESLDKLIYILESIGSIPINLDGEEHDKVTATISHVPHVIASGLVNLVKDLDTDGKMQTLAAGGFKDITRIASSSPLMWENIVLSNGEKICTVLNKFIESLNKFMEYINKNDKTKIYEFFESAKIFRDTFSNQKRGLILPINEIIVDVVDRPGIIGEIATILAQHNINIKNINVSNTREQEQGCMRITLPDMDSVDLSYKVLIQSGYKCYKI